MRVRRSSWITDMASIPRSMVSPSRSYSCHREDYIISSKASITDDSSSGIRAIFACTPPLQLGKWDSHSIIPSSDPLPEPMMKQIEQLASQQPFGDGRVHIGFASIKYFLSKEMILATFRRV
jgi:hypothetical protein